MSFDKIKSCSQSTIDFLPIVLLGDFNALHFNYGDTYHCQTSIVKIIQHNITPSGEAIRDLII